MPLVSMTTLLERAYAGGYGVGYFEAWDSYSLEAVVEAAEAERSPVIIGFGCMMVSSDWLDKGGVEILGALGRQAAERISVPTAFILNETHTFEQAERGIAAGFNTVMMDTSAWDWDRSIEAIQRLVAIARASNATVEAELGRLPDAVEDGIDDSTAFLTDPDQAAEFVRQTGVDFLAVSIGNIHLLTNGYAPVDMDHLERIRQRVNIPFVIHGGTSFPPSAVPRAIANNAVKFNVGTVLKKSFWEGTREVVLNAPVPVNVHDTLGSHKDTDALNAGKARMKAKVQELMRLYGSSGKAL